MHAQLELDHTAVLHLRSRRFSSDAAVYDTMGAFSLLLCGLRERQDRPAGSSSAASSFHVPAHCAGEGGLGRSERDLHRSGALSGLIEAAVAVLQGTPVARLVSALPSPSVDELEAAACVPASELRGCALQQLSGQAMVRMLRREARWERLCLCVSIWRGPTRGQPGWLHGSCWTLWSGRPGPWVWSTMLHSDIGEVRQCNVCRLMCGSA